MFRRLSVFVGGCSLNDAAMLLDAAPDEGGDTLEECAALVDHSLVRRGCGRRIATADDARDIREFGLERLREAGRRRMRDVRTPRGSSHSQNGPNRH